MEHEHGHRRVELISIAIHEAVAACLDDDGVVRARTRIQAWSAGEKIHPRYAEQWLAVLALPLAEIKAAIVRDNQEMRDLRQNTPFAGFIDEEERLRIIGSIR